MVEACIQRLVKYDICIIAGDKVSRVMKMASILGRQIGITGGWSDVTCALVHLITPITQLFVENHVHANKKERTKALQRIQGVTDGFPAQRASNATLITWYDIIVCLLIQSI